MAVFLTIIGGLALVVVVIFGIIAFFKNYKIVRNEPSKETKKESKSGK